MPDTKPTEPSAEQSCCECSSNASKAEMTPSDTHIGRDATREELDRPRFWEAMYEEQGTPGFDIGEPNPELVWRLDNEIPTIEPGKVIIPGCGFAHDAALLAGRGFEVTAVDYAPQALAGAKERLESKGLEVNYLQSDIFELDESHNGVYDYLIEHTCFCAIHPDRRQEYAALAARLLKPGGQILGIFYAHGKEGGPPYNTTPEAVRAAFEPHFDCRTLVIAQRSVERREGNELYGRFWRKG